MEPIKPLSQLIATLSEPPASENGPRKKNESCNWPEYPYPFSAKRVAVYQAELRRQPLPPMCPECGNTGYVKEGDVPVGHSQFGKIKACPTCNQQRRIEWLARNCGLTEAEQGLSRKLWRAGGWEEATPETRQRYREQRRAAIQALNTALKDRVGLYTFFGDCGAGKSLALQIVANEVRLQMIESFYAPLGLLLEQLRALYPQGEAANRFWQRLLDIPVLCLDEITRFNESGWAREKLFLLIDTRYRRRASHLTLLATNEDPTQKLPPGEDIGYLFSRMREGRLLELRGDMREVVGVQGGGEEGQVNPA